MSSTPINNLMTIAAPRPLASTVSPVDSKQFDSYLHKAAAPLAAAEKPAPIREPETPQSEPTPESETIESSNQEQAASSEDQDDTKDTANEQPVAREKESASKENDDDQDEVLLSDTAVASTTSQNEKPAFKNEGTEKGELANATANSDQDPQQSDSKASLETEPVEAHIDKTQLEGDPEIKQGGTENADETEVHSQVSTGIMSEGQVAEKAEPTENKSSKQSRDVRPQGESENQPETFQDALAQKATGEKSKNDTVAVAQQVARVENVATDHGPRTTEISSTATSASPSSSQPSVVQTVTSAIQPGTEPSSSQTTSEPTAATTDRGRFVHRVANAFRSAQQNDGEIQLRLSPPELGSLKIEIAVRHGVLTARLETETVDARHTLLDNLPALRQRLAEQDIRIERFEVDIRRDGGQGQPGTEDRQPRDGSNRGSTTQRNRVVAEPEVNTSRVPRAAMNLTPDSLDVRI